MPHLKVLRHLTMCEDPETQFLNWEMDQPRKNKDSQLVSDFFEGRSIFLTGASGFLGTVLLETLLRCCPGIASVYILLRSKRGLTPEQRKQMIFEKKVFTVLKDRNPEFLKKVQVVVGDISKPEFGMDEKSLQCIVDDVSIVFHCAANINLAKPLRYMIEQNCVSTKSVIELCRKMKKFCALVYTSTSYSNCNRLDFPIKEEIYRLPFHAGKFLDALKHKNRDKLLELVSLCKPDWPSWYLYSKCLSENVLQDMGSDLPFAILRPPIIGSTWKNPMPGFREQDSSVTLGYYIVGEGFYKVIHCDSNIVLYQVPVEIVANMHLIAAWGIGTKKVTSPSVINCTPRSNLNCKWKESLKIVKKIREDFSPLKYPQSLKKLIFCKNQFLYWMAIVYYHYVPGFVTDIILKIKGKQPRALLTYYFLQKHISYLEKVAMHSPQYETNNMYYLNGLLHEEDKMILENDTQNVTMEEYMRPAFEEKPSYDFMKYLEIMIQYDWLISIFQYLVLITGGYLIYWLVNTLFQYL